MNRSIVATIAAKDLRLVVSKTGIRISIMLFPLLVAVGLPAVLRFAGARHGGVPVAVLPRLLDAFAFFFIVAAAMLPAAIASYSLVGEKVERSLEPLLATPATDLEILVGKGVAAVLPPLAAIWVSGALFMALCDRLTGASLGYRYFPNAVALIIFLVLVPLTAIMSVEYDVLISARVADVRSAQQLGALPVLPFAGLYVTAEVGAISLTPGTLWVIAGVLAAGDVVLFAASRATFRREEILTRWR